jgi:hypothetical protein
MSTLSTFRTAGCRSQLPPHPLWTGWRTCMTGAWLTTFPWNSSVVERNTLCMQWKPPPTFYNDFIDFSGIPGVLGRFKDHFAYIFGQIFFLLPYSNLVLSLRVYIFLKMLWITYCDTAVPTIPIPNLFHLLTLDVLYILQYTCSFQAKK